MCLILLLLYSVTAYSFFTVSYYSHVIPSTDTSINIYVEQQYVRFPIKVNLSFSNLYISFYIFNMSRMNISYSTSFNLSYDRPIIFYHKNINATIIKANYMFASNMSITLSTPFQHVKIIGNISNENISIPLTSYSTSNLSKLHGFNFNYITFIFISITAIFLFIVLRRYKGH